MKKIIISIVLVFEGIILGTCIVGKKMSEKCDEIKIMSDKHLTLFRMMCQWIRVKQENKRLDDYLKELGYLNIAVYGMSYAGRVLIDELDESDVKILYGIDKNSELMYKNIKTVSPDGTLKPVDVVIVTAVTFFNEIEKILSEKVECPIISLEDILFEI